MPELTEAERQAYAILPTLVREDEYKAKLDTLVQRRQEAEAAAKSLQDEREKLEKVKEDTNLYVAQKTEELNTAQKEHDASAEEAHKRITLSREQDEMLARKADALDRREKDVTEREAAVKKLASDVARREDTLRTHEAEVQILQNDLKDKHARLKEILE